MSADSDSTVLVEAIRSKANIALLFLSFLLGMSACGGKAIIDPPLEGAGGSSSVSNVATATGSTQTTSVTGSGGCECSSNNDCPTVDDACYEFSCDGCTCQQIDLPAGSSCGTSVCDGKGNCVECTDPNDCKFGGCENSTCQYEPGPVCVFVCDVVAKCTSVEDCQTGCTQDLLDCSQSQLVDLLGCTNALSKSCDLESWLACAGQLGCLDIDI